MRIVPAHGRAAALGLALLALLGAAAGLWSARDRAWDAVAGHPYFVVRQISVRGAERYLSETAVLDWLAVAPGDSLWSVSPARARRRLESHPFVASASVRREFPDRLHIELRERRPRAIVLLDRLYYLDRAGTVFGPLEADHGRDFPVLTGVNENCPAGRRAVVLRRLSRLARLCARRACFGGVSELHLDPVRGVVLHPATPRIPIVLGWGSWREKIERAERALATRPASPEGVAALDARFRNQVVVKLAAQDSEAWGPGAGRWNPDRPPTTDRQRPRRGRPAPRARGGGEV
jgi:cell division protein FtsQ